MFRRRMALLLLLATVCGGGAAWLVLARPIVYVQIEHRLRDLIARSGRTTAPNPELLFLAIDSDSITLDEDLDLNRLFPSSATDPECRHALEIMAKSWPWNREIYALVLERLLHAGAKVVAFDCLFPEPAAGDDAFRNALDHFKSQVVIGSNFVSPADVDLTRRVPSTLALPTPTLIPKSLSPDDRVGFTNFFAGENQIVRAAQYRVAFREHENVTATYFALSARTAAKAGHADLVPDDLVERLIRFTGPPRLGFHPHSIFEIFVPEYWQHNYRSGELLRGKIIVIGAEGKWQRDELATPFGPMPGAEVHLNALNALLHHEFLKDLAPSSAALIAMSVAFVGAAICLTIRSPSLRLLALALLDAAWPFVGLWFYNHPAIYLPVLAPLLAFNATVVLSLVSDFTFERTEKTRLRSTLRTRDELTHMIVHDLRSPLTVVAGYVDALEQMASAKLNPTEAKFVAAAKRGANDMRDLITTLLDLNRFEAGQMPLRLQPNDISHIARQAAEHFAPLMKDRHLDCEMPASVIVHCDPDIIRRVLENLISNAIKFTASDGTIRVTVSPNENDVAVSVSDNGPGIPAAQHKRIFEKFGQTESGAQQKNSTGIGLAFCRLAVEAHGGKIDVESESGEGTTLTFNLPIAHPADLNKEATPTVV